MFVHVVKVRITFIIIAPIIISASERRQKKKTIRSMFRTFCAGEKKNRVFPFRKIPVLGCVQFRFKMSLDFPV